MRPIVRDSLTRILSSVGIYATRMTPQKELKELIGSLRPRLTDRDMIRLGPLGDGGYLVPDDLAGIGACFSPGVALLSGFERDCADLGMEVFMADGSVDGPAESHDAFHFVKKFVGATTNDDVMTVDQWVASSLPNSDEELLFQIDIEGGEYETFLSISDSLMRRFRIIVAEFHELDKLFSRPFFGIAKSAFEKILQSHVCVHIHPNNVSRSVSAYGLEIPRLAEFTFVRNDRVHDRGFARQFPHPFDSDNTGNRGLPLPKCWY